MSSITITSQSVSIAEDGRETTQNRFFLHHYSRHITEGAGMPATDRVRLLSAT